ncbi:MAG TPA: ABC transporter substrate-binding protein [Candidatus Nanoarchaeia archaeon]|nr:ABC transporter substrate-binding protein [Candidatus Nanoarchaeia archaeon]
MKKFVWVAFILALLLGCSNEKITENTINIGAVLPLTGSAAVYGQNAQHGIDLAVKEINVAGGINGKPIRVIYEDDGTEAVKSVTAIQKLIDIDGVHVIIGGVWDFLANADIPVIDQQKVLLLSPSALPDTVTQTSSYFFVFHSPVASNQVVFEKWLKLLPSKRVGAIVISNPWGLAHLDTFKKAVQATGATLIEERILPNFDNNDISTELTKFQSENLDGLFAAINFNDFLMLDRKRKELDFQSSLLAHENFADHVKSGRLDASNAEGVYVFGFSEPTPEFVTKFINAYGESPVFVGDIAYDIVYALKMAMEGSGENTDQIIQVLQKIDFQGASGRIYLGDKNYPLNKKPILEKIVNGKFITVY